MRVPRYTFTAAGVAAATTAIVGAKYTSNKANECAHKVNDLNAEWDRIYSREIKESIRISKEYQPLLQQPSCKDVCTYKDFKHELTLAQLRQKQRDLSSQTSREHTRLSSKAQVYANEYNNDINYTVSLAITGLLLCYGALLLLPKAEKISNPLPSQ